MRFKTNKQASLQKAELLRVRIVGAARYTARAFILLMILVMATLSGQQFMIADKVLAATGVARPDGDVARQWASFTDGNAGDGETCDATNHWRCVNEATYTGTDYINTGLAGAGGEIEQYTTTSAAGTTVTVTTVAVRVYAWSNGGCTSTCDTLSVNISIDGATQTAQTMTMTGTADTNQTFTFNGTWTGDDDLQVIITRNVQGTGPAGNRDDDVRLAYVDATVTYTVNIAQTNYRWRDDSAALNTNSGWLAAENTKPANADTAMDDILRLRVEVANAGIAGTANSGYRLQWAVKAASCSASSGWTRIDTASDAWEMVASAQYADGGSLSSSYLTASEPTFVNGYGLEFTGDDQSAAIQLDPDDYTEIEWAIKANSTATPGQSYCFRAVDDTGTALTSYTNYPEVTLYIGTHAEITQEGYIFEYDNGANADSNGQQAAANSAISGVRKGERMVLRSHLKNTGNLAVGSGLALFYDRGDGVWTKVENGKPVSGAGSGCTDTAWTCTAIETTNSAGIQNSMAIDQFGNPWASYRHSNNLGLSVARYVGAGGTGCGSTAWVCTNVDNTADVGNYTAIAINGPVSVWVSYYDNANSGLKVARYVGSGGTGCSTTAWTCYSVDTANDVGNETAIAIDSDGNPWVSYRDSTNLDLRVARFVGASGSGCASAAWTCTAVEGTNDVGQFSSIAFDPSGNAWVSYYDGTNSALRLAQYVGGTGGSGCADTAWTCSTIESANSVGSYTSIAFDSSGDAWISHRDSTTGDLRVAQYVGSGGSGCDLASWTCAAIDTSGSAWDTSIAMGASGNPWISFYETDSTSVRIARYVGSGGSGCALSSWTCTNIDSANDVGQHTSIAFDASGNPWVSYRDTTNNDLRIATITRQSEITISPGLSAINGASLTESHADMSSVADSANRDDADCLTGGAVWNNGIHSTSAEVSVGLPAGDTTPQCTEIAWVIDTSQALEGTTYRFMVASKDGWRHDKGLWRGPVLVSNYPTLNIETDTDIRYSKDSTPGFANCAIDTSWGCQTIAATGNVGSETYMRFDPDGVPWVAYQDTTGIDLEVAKYVGSGGNCDTLAAGSDAWDCTTVDANGEVGYFISMAFNSKGVPSIVYSKGISSNQDLWIATFVGSGGNCDDTGGSDAWQCTAIATTDNIGTYPSIDFDASDVAWISYRDETGGDLELARYVGSGGNCDTLLAGSDAWQCETLDATNNVGYTTALEVGQDGMIWIAYEDYTAGSVKVAKYVGSGGNCDTTGGSDAWNCTTADDRSTNVLGYDIDIAIDPSGNPWIAHLDNTGADLELAYYVGSGGDCDTLGTGSDAWECDTIDATGSVGYTPGIAFSPSGVAWVSYWDFTNNRLKVARYVTSGGNCDTTGGSDAWECTNITSLGGYYSSIDFDRSGMPWVSHTGDGFTDLFVSKLHLPRGPLGNDQGGKMTPSGDLAYRLDDGRSDRSAYNGTCGASVASYMGYCGVFDNQGDYDSIVTGIGERPVYGGAVQFTSNTQTPTVLWEGRSSLAPSTAGVDGDLYLQVYRFGTTNAWETVVSDTASTDCNTGDCSLSGTPSGTATEYFQTSGSEYWAYFRVYQVQSTSSITFKVDKFSAAITSQRLRGGRVFEGGITKPLLTN